MHKCTRPILPKQLILSIWSYLYVKNRNTSSLSKPPIILISFISSSGNIWLWPGTYQIVIHIYNADNFLGNKESWISLTLLEASCFESDFEPFVPQLWCFYLHIKTLIEIQYIRPLLWGCLLVHMYNRNQLNDYLSPRFMPRSTPALQSTTLQHSTSLPINTTSTFSCTSF